MKPNFLKDKLATTVLEKEEKKQQAPQNVQKVENKLADKPILQEKQVAVKQESVQPKVNLFSAKTFEDAKEKSENILFKKVEKIKPEEVVQETRVEKKEEEIVDEEFISFAEKPKPKKKEWKFRLKLVTIIYCAVIAVMGGWVTTNIFRIANMNNTITSTQGEVSANYAKYISQIEKLEDLKENPDNNTSLIPIDEIITVTPLPQEDVTEFERQSNWFDNIVNWFGNLFGG